MAIFAIGDLHLSFGENKPMDIFGENWTKHDEKIKKDWKKKVSSQDTVLLPGDFSWAMNLEDTNKDFQYLTKLPGRKILLKGNHDYWWTTVTNMRNFLRENHFEEISFLYNNSYLIEGTIICGTRGWNLKDLENDAKILKRELNRLELSLKDGISKYGTEKEIIVCMHYPPVYRNHEGILQKSDFMELMKQYNVKICLYGHLHGQGHKEAIEGEVEGIELKLISSDYLDFKLEKIKE